MHEFEAVTQRESNARNYAVTFPTLFTSGEGIWLQDHTGKKYIDCLSCAGALSLGHNHPEVKQALLNFLASGHVQQVLDLTTPAKHQFINRLFNLLPPTFAQRAKIHFCSPCGADAVEAAMKLVRFATQRQPIVAFHGAYHGMTRGALAAMGNLFSKVNAGVGAEHIHFAPFPYRYRCPFGTDGQETDQLSIDYLKNLLDDPESGVAKPAGVLVEVVQGEGGCIPASAEWLRALRELTQQHQIPLIIDEVQTGLCRTGSMFAFQQAGIVPDVLILSKAVGGGYPLSLIVYDQALDVWPKGIHDGTFRGNQIAMAAGEKTMEILQRDRLDDHARNMGEKLSAGLHALAALHPEFGDIRGRGLMLGVEIIHPHGELGGQRNGELARRIKEAAFQRGMLLETGGRHAAVLRFLPPLIIGAQDVDNILNRLADAIADAKKIKRPAT